MFDNFLSGYLTVCSAALLTLAAWLVVTRARLWWWGERTTGEIIRYTERMRSRPGEKIHHMPQVRFTDDRGMLRDFTSTTSADPAKWPVGTHVAVIFAKNDADKAEIGLPLLFWRGPVGVLVFGLGVLLAAVKAAG